jgi:hypothetical protein
MKKNKAEKLPPDIQKILNDKKGLNLDKVVQSALTDEEILEKILKAQVSKKETYRYNCFKVLLQISENHPQILYPEWNYFLELLSSDNSYHRIAAINIISNLVSADSENRFEKIFNQYFNLLDDKSMITAIFLARSAGKIAKAKPNLQKRITERLLNIDKTHHEQDRKDLIKSGAIESFEEYVEESHDKQKILAFVEQQLQGESPKTRKIAEAFLGKYGKKG